MTTQPSQRRVELFVRSLSPEPARSPPDNHLERLRNLAANDETVDLSVTVWGREVGLSTTAVRTDPGRFVLDRVGAFRRWADERGVSLEPFFDTRAVDAGLRGEGYTALVLPVCCLAEYEDEELVHVAPFATGDAVYSVADRIRRLEARSHPEVRASVDIDDRAGPDDHVDREPTIRTRSGDRTDTDPAGTGGDHDGDRPETEFVQLPGR